jgi:hypothetical protein
MVRVVIPGLRSACLPRSALGSNKSGPSGRAGVFTCMPLFSSDSSGRQFLQCCNAHHFSIPRNSQALAYTQPRITAHTRPGLPNGVVFFRENFPDIKLLTPPLAVATSFQSISSQQGRGASALRTSFGRGPARSQVWASLPQFSPSENADYPGTSPTYGSGHHRQIPAH